VRLIVRKIRYLFTHYKVLMVVNVLTGLQKSCCVVVSVTTCFKECLTASQTSRVLIYVLLTLDFVLLGGLQWFGVTCCLQLYMEKRRFNKFCTCSLQNIYIHKKIIHTTDSKKRRAGNTRPSNDGGYTMMTSCYSFPVYTYFS
jgi:hypothetical protein